MTSFCINCAHIGTNGARDWELYRCFAEQNIKARTVNLVTGETQTDYAFLTCKSARLSSEACGPDGVWFQQKPVREPSSSQATSLDDLDLDI